MDVSLFQRLSEAHPHAVATLSAQYRMCDPIMAVCNTLTYGGELTCGSDESRMLRLSCQTRARCRSLMTGCCRPQSFGWTRWRRRRMAARPCRLSKRRIKPPPQQQHLLRPLLH